MIDDESREDFMKETKINSPMPYEDDVFPNVKLIKDNKDVFGYFEI